MAGIPRRHPPPPRYERDPPTVGSTPGSCASERSGTSLPGDVALRQHDSPLGRAALPRQLAPRATDQESRPLERDGHGRPGQSRERGTRRAHLDVRVLRDALRGRLQPFPPRPRRGRARRHGLLPGPRLARRLCPRLPGGPAQRGAAPELPARVPASQRAVVLSAPLAHAGLLGVPVGLHGPRAHHGHLSGPLPTLPSRPRPQGHGGQPGLVLHRRRGVRRARESRLDLARRPGTARQPDLRRQLQPPASRRTRPRQRQDHPGARIGLPGRRLERDQGHLGRRLGSAARARPGRTSRGA